MEMMGMAECKAKLGNRGHIKGEKTFNQKCGMSGHMANSPKTSWQGKTKGKTTGKETR